VPDHVTRGDRVVVELLEVVAPVRDVLHSFPPGVEEVLVLHAVDIEPGADAMFDPVVHGGVDIAHDVPDLGDLAEFPAHDSVSFHISRLELIAAVAARRVARPPGSSAVEGTTATLSAPASR